MRTITPLTTSILLSPYALSLSVADSRSLIKAVHFLESDDVLTSSDNTDSDNTDSVESKPIDIDNTMERTDNAKVLETYFTGLASCAYYNGLCYQLYLNLDDLSIVENVEVSCNSWLGRDNGSLIRIYQVSGYADTPMDERYSEGCDLSDFGYADWLDELKAEIKQALDLSEVDYV